MSTLRRGDRFGDYEIVARLRSGGMATLYLGCRRGAAGFSRPVAIKIIHPHLARDPTFVKMFIDEAKLSARIEDPHVVHVEDLGEANGALFLAMEYVPGCSLAQLLAALSKEGRRLDTSAIVHIGAQIASGLQAAHELADERGSPLGVVHRDVSPSNVLVARKGHVKLIDFGIAKVRSRAQQQTNTKALKGKLAYMSPEQARIEPVDLRTDLYALGVILWELVTMKRCFEATTDVGLLEMVRRPNVVPPSRYAEVPPALEMVIMAALEPKADKRPQTAAELRRMLLDAVPAASGVDRTDVAILVERLLGAKLDQEQKLLPIDEHVYGEVASTPAEASAEPPEPEPEPDVTATSAAPDMAFAATEPGAGSPSNQRSPDARWESLTQAATVTKTMWEEPAPAPAPAVARRWLYPTLIAAGAVVAVLAVVVGVASVRARAASQATGGEAPPVVATQLATASPAPSAEAAPAPLAPAEPPPANAQGGLATEVSDAAAPLVKRTPPRGRATALPAPLATVSARRPVELINGVPINTNVGK